MPTTPERAGREAAFASMIQHARSEWEAQRRDVRTRRDRATLKHYAKIHNRLLRQSGMRGDMLEEGSPVP